MMVYGAMIVTITELVLIAGGIGIAFALLAVLPAIKLSKPKINSEIAPGSVGINGVYALDINDKAAFSLIKVNGEKLVLTPAAGVSHLEFTIVEFMDNGKKKGVTYSAKIVCNDPIEVPLKSRAFKVVAEKINHKRNKDAETKSFTFGKMFGHGLLVGIFYAAVFVGLGFFTLFHTRQFNDGVLNRIIFTGIDQFIQFIIYACYGFAFIPLTIIVDVLFANCGRKVR